MTEALLTTLPRDVFLNIYSNFTAPQLCLTRLVCKHFQDLIDASTQNPLWRNIVLQTNLRPMTSEENQAPQAYLRKNWKFCLLNAIPDNCFTPTVLNRIRAAIRSGHEAIVCQNLDRWKKQPLLLDDAYKFALESIDARLGLSFFKLIGFHKSWSLNEGAKKEVMKMLFCRTALKGQLEMITGLAVLNAQEPFLSNQEIIQAFDLSASQGDRKMVRFLLDNYHNLNLLTTIDPAYHQALVFSPCSETTEFLRTKASVEAQKSEKGQLINSYKTQFCTNWLGLPSAILQQRAEFYLKQDGFFDSLSDAHKKNIIKQLKECFSPAVFQLFMTHLQFAPLIAANEGLLIILMRTVCNFNEFYTVEALISFLKTLEKAPLQGKRDFKSYAAEVIWATIISGRDDFIQPFVQNFPDLIPANLIPRFLAAAQSSSSGNVYQQLVAGGGFEEMQWFCKYIEVEQFCDAIFIDDRL